MVTFFQQGFNRFQVSPHIPQLLTDGFPNFLDGGLLASGKAEVIPPRLLLVGAKSLDALFGLPVKSQDQHFRFFSGFIECYWHNKSTHWGCGNFY